MDFFTGFFVCRCLSCFCENVLFINILVIIFGWSNWMNQTRHRMAKFHLISVEDKRLVVFIRLPFFVWKAQGNFAWTILNVVDICANKRKSYPIFYRLLDLHCQSSDHGPIGRMVSLDTIGFDELLTEFHQTCISCLILGLSSKLYSRNSTWQCVTNSSLCDTDCSCIRQLSRLHKEFVCLKTEIQESFIMTDYNVTAEYWNWHRRQYWIDALLKAWALLETTSTENRRQCKWWQEMPSDCQNSASNVFCALYKICNFVKTAPGNVNLIWAFGIDGLRQIRHHFWINIVSREVRSVFLIQQDVQSDRCHDEESENLRNLAMEGVKYYTGCDHWTDLE
jgi:hypothetical protein